MVDERKRSRIPTRFWGFEIDRDYRTPPGSPEALAAVHTYLDHLEERRKEGRGLLFLGEPGRGKTTLACAVGLEVMKAGYAVAFSSLASYVRMYQRLFELKDLWKFGDDEALHEWKLRDERLRVWRNELDFLIIDDVGKEHLTTSRFAEDEFDFLIRYRYDRGLPTILTSNQPTLEWSQRYSEAMASFVREACIVVHVGGDDARFS